MSSYMTLAFKALDAAELAGTEGSLERRVVDGLAGIGSFAGASIGELDGNGSPLRQLLRAMDPQPEHGRTTIYRALVGGGPRHFLAAVKAAIPAPE